MKKYAFGLAAIAIALLLTSFTVFNKPKESTSALPYKWWDFYGNIWDQTNPLYYAEDPDGYPECPYMLGGLYCAIRALPLQEDDGHPDLSTITHIRYYLW